MKAVNDKTKQKVLEGLATIYITNGRFPTYRELGSHVQMAYGNLAIACKRLGAEGFVKFNGYHVIGLKRDGLLPTTQAAYQVALMRRYAEFINGV